MAGVKVTDLTTLGAAASDDVFYIVDTSANQSKKIEVQNIYDGMPQLASGTFTPTPSNVTPGTSTVAITGGMYSRVGNIVTMSFYFEVQFGITDDTLTFNFDLPVATNLTTAKDIVGCVTSDFAVDLNQLLVYANATNNLGEIQFIINSPGNNYTYVRAVLQYEIK